jgi:hypothetical protein
MLAVTAITVGITVPKYLIGAMVLILILMLSTLVSISKRWSLEYLFQETLCLNFVIASGGDCKI